MHVSKPFELSSLGCESTSFNQRSALVSQSHGIPVLFPNFWDRFFRILDWDQFLEWYWDWFMEIWDWDWIWKFLGLGSIIQNFGIRIDFTKFLEWNWDWILKLWDWGWIWKFLGLGLVLNFSKHGTGIGIRRPVPTPAFNSPAVGMDSWIPFILSNFYALILQTKIPRISPTSNSGR